MNENDKSDKPENQDLPMSEERWRRFTWMPGDLVIVGKDEGETEAKPKAKRKPKPKPET